MTKAIFISEQKHNIRDVDVDLSVENNQLYNVLGGKATFIGQWPDIDVVIVKRVDGDQLNENKLPTPFDQEDVMGPIMLIRMDENSEPQDFTLREFRRLRRWNECFAV